MLSKGNFLLCLLVLVADPSSAEGSGTDRRRGYYTVVAPKILRTNSPYHVSASLTDYSQSVWFNISLRDGDKYRTQASVEVHPKTTKLISFQLEKINSIYLKIDVIGNRGIVSKEGAEVIVQEPNHQVYIQTDKPKYKPGDLARFRVICLDEFTRLAVTDESLDILIYDGDNNLLKMAKDIKLTHGVFKGQQQLADNTLLGTWKIQVKSNGLPIKEKTFLVARYVLQMFTVQIVTKPDVFVNDDKIEIMFIAKYAHDLPIMGNLLVNFTLDNLVSGTPHLTVSREMQLDGVQLISLDLKRDLQMRRTDVKGMRTRLYSLSVDAHVTDSITREIVEEKAVIGVHKSPYKIKLEAPMYFDPEVPVNVRVAVADLQDTPVQAGENPVVIWLSPGAPLTIYLNKEGFGVAQLNLTNTKHRLWAEFHGYTSSHEELQPKANKGIRLTVLTPRPDVGEEIVVQLTSRNPIDHFVYEVVSRGNIIQAERINVPKEATTHEFRMNTTQAMAPLIILYVHSVRKREETFVSGLVQIVVGRAFQNSIAIDVEKEVVPGASVSVNVSTDEDSYVGLMAIDKRLLSDIQHDDFSEDRDFNQRIKVDDSSVVGLITLSNFLCSEHDEYDDLGEDVKDDMDYEVDEDDEDDEDDDDEWDDMDVFIPNFISSHDIRPLLEVPQTELRKNLLPAIHRKTPKPSPIRRIFSDGWLFDDFESTPRGGLQLHSTIPDAITSWAVTGFSLNPRSGLSFTENAATLRAFQPFFILMDLPNLVREGEILEVPVYVFNYFKADAVMEVSIDSPSEHVVLLDSLSKDASPWFNNSFSISISAQGRVRLTFPIISLKTGLFNVTVRAASSIGSDAVQKTLTVVSKGSPHFVSMTYLVHFLQESEHADELLVNIPENAVQGSEQVELSVVGDTFRPLLDSLSNLVQVPYGNGKETTMQFISNLLVLKYLKTLNVTNPSMERRAQSFLELGYQSLLNLKEQDDSFSFFGRPTKTTGDALQTAIVLWALQQATSFIQVDHKVLIRCKNYYLKPKQAPNGGFQSGTGLDDDVTLTSVALLALMEDEANADVVSRGLAFLYNSLDDLQSPTSAALSKYVLVVGRHEKSQEILSQLSGHSSLNRTGRRVLWDKSTTIQGVLEATSGSFLSILQSQAKPTDTLIPIVMALLSPGHSDKIPTHLMALDAMIGVARDMHFDARNLHIHFESDQGEAGDLRVNPSNVHVLQTVQLNSATRKVRIATKGQGLAVVTVKSRYNRPRENLTTSTFLTNVTASERAETLVELKVCVSSRVAGGTGNFTAVEVNLPSGYTVLEDQEDNPFNSHLGKYETDKWFGTQAAGISPKLRAFKVDSSAGSVHAIFEDIDQLGACFDLSAVRAFKVLSARVVSIVVYDVYDEGQKSTMLHELVFTNID